MESKAQEQIEGGLVKQKKEFIQKFVKQWMDGYGPDTFIKNEHGAVIYSAGSSSLNLVSFFEDLLEEYEPKTENGSLFEIDFDGCVKARMLFKDGGLAITDAMNGYGDSIPPIRINIQSIPAT